MATSRRLETALSEQNPRWFSTAGEEGVIVGSFAELQDGDIAAPHYRGPFVVYLMRGANLKRLVAQALGKASGYNKGRSVPFTGPGKLGFVPWVAGDLGTSIGVATGAALALQRQEQGRVCVSSFGDGTSNRGDFHENINTAALWHLPIVYVCQNNGWAISQSASSYLPAPVVDRAAGYGIPGVSVDGNDVEAVRDAVSTAVALARRGEGPTLIEAMTWRVGGHWAGDKTPYRSSEQQAFHATDPLDVLRTRLLKDGVATAEDLAEFETSFAQEVDQAIQEVRAMPDAGEAQLGLDEVCPAQA